MASEDYREAVAARIDKYYPTLKKKLSRLPARKAEVDPKKADRALLDLMWRNRSEYIDEATREGIGLVDIRSAEMVTVYRVVSNTTLSEVDLAWNYTSSSSEYLEDYVARSFDETLNYVYDESATLIRYEIPANLLEYGKWVKEEASFVISRKQLKKYGLPSPAPFVAAIAEVSPSVRASDFRNSINALEGDSPYLKWLTPDQLNTMISKQMKKKLSWNSGRPPEP